MLRRTFFVLLLVSSTFVTVFSQQVAEVTTDFGGFWRSGIGTLNATYPNTGHNLLSFKYNSVMYSTGVDDARLTANSVSFTTGDFRAFPVGTVGGTITSGSSIYIALASRYDGVPNGYSNPLPSLRIKDVLIDGIHGLDLGTGATNIPASALISFPISSVTSASISDNKPDIVVSQIASPTATGDTLFFTNSAGVVVGNKVPINWTSIGSLGTYYLDLYNLPGGALCDTAHINGTADKETTREIRMIAFKLSDFGITIANSVNISGFILKASGTSDPAFIAYNTDAFTIPAPVITVHPATQVVCPNVSNSVTFTVTATGGSLTYQWKKNNIDIPGATSSSYTIANVVSSSAGAYNVVVSNPVGSVLSNTAYLNVSILVQPSPAAQLIATGAACTLSVNANNATGFQWKKGSVDISGATSATLILNPVTGTDTSSYSVRIINTAGGGCASVTSNSVMVAGSKILYSKPGVNLNLPASWGVNTDGSGSSPVDFTRTEHTFVVKNNAATAGNLTIAGVLDVAGAITTITANTTLDARRIIRSGSGSLAGSGTSSLVVRDTSTIYFKSGNDTLKNFTVNGGNVTLFSPLNITAGSVPGTVTLNAGVFNTGGYLTLKSNIAGTARLAALGGTAAINGEVSIERYIPAARGWRYLSVPISASGAPTINQAWQEGVTTASANTNPNPGFGGQITGGTTANGFDQSSTNNVSIKIYNNSTGSFTRLPASPGTNIPITNYPAYCVYFRGDRGIDLMQGLNAAITSTTLRMKGQVNTGSQALSVNALNYTLVGNPYPSAIDFETLTRSNVANTIYIWDPKMAGNYGLGGYVTLSWNNSTHSYDKTSSVSPVSKYIQSGEAFFVSSADHINPGTLTVKETDKAIAGSDQVYRSAESDERIRINMYAVSNDSVSLLDGVLTTYADENENIIDNDDAKKMWGSNQSLNIKRDGQYLAIERRKPVVTADSIFLNLYQMKPQDYQLEIIAGNMNAAGRLAVVKDNYSNAINNTNLDLTGTTIIPFTVNADPASYAVNRFSIVFQHLAVLPVTFTSVKAYRDQTAIKVEWKTDNEINISKYQVEHSNNGLNFSTAASLSPTANNGASAAYSWPDMKPVSGFHYYRIKSLGNDHEQKYSAVVKVELPATGINNKLIVYPNPVKDARVKLQMAMLEKGEYIISLFNSNGQLIKKAAYKHLAGRLDYLLAIGDSLPAGKYEVQLAGNGKKWLTSLIKE